VVAVPYTVHFKHCFSPPPLPSIIFRCILNSPWQPAEAYAELREGQSSYFVLRLEHYVMLRKELYKFHNFSVTGYVRTIQANITKASA
jgi:hypothetical protein